MLNEGAMDFDLIMRTLEAPLAMLGTNSNVLVGLTVLQPYVLQNR